MIPRLTFVLAVIHLLFVPRGLAEPVTDCLSGERVRWVVPFKPGGGYDLYSRLLEPHMERVLGAELRVENIPGAGGLVGCTQVMRAKPDGKTVGLVNGAGLLAAVLGGAAEAVNPTTDFTLLARVSRSYHVWFVRRDSEVRDMGDVFRLADEGRLVFGVRDVGSSSFSSIVLGKELVGIEGKVIAGYTGTEGTLMSVIRGEVDIASISFDSIRGAIESGEIRPVLQMCQPGVITHPSIEGIAALGGPGGLAVQRATSIGLTSEKAEARADAITTLVGAGRLFVAPPGLDPALTTCLRNAIAAVLHDPGFIADADKRQRSLDVASGEEVAAELARMDRELDELRPVLEAAVLQVRKE